MALTQSTNKSFLINENKSVTFWGGSGSDIEKIKYIVRDIQSGSWGPQGVAIHAEGLRSGGFGSFDQSDFLFRKISDDKIFIAVRGGSTENTVIYSFGTILGNTIEFSAHKILQRLGEDAEPTHLSVSALVINDDSDPFILFSFTEGSSFRIVRIIENEDDSDIGDFGSIYPYYTRLIRKNNLVLASGLTPYQSSVTFTGCRPFVRAFNLSIETKNISPVTGGYKEWDVPLLTGSGKCSALDIFFTGEGYNFMILGPIKSTSAVPA